MESSEGDSEQPAGQLHDVLNAFGLDGQVALVTGGGTGLGRAISVGLASVGAHVVVVGRRAQPLEQSVELIRGQGGRADSVIHDLSDAATIPALVDEVARLGGRLDILVNNAGMTIVKPSVDLSISEWDEIVDVNLRSAFFCSAAAVRQFDRQESRGVILNIASIAAIRGGAGVYSAYSATKGGLVSLTQSHATEWAPRGVRVNCVAVGAFHTGMSAAAYSDPAVHAKYVRRIPLGRTAEPQELAPLAVYLCSPASRFMTGETVVIDGGQTMR